jgi:DDE superfamily endonuclease
LRGQQKVRTYISKVPPSRDGLEFPILMTERATRHASAEGIVLAIDNLSTHNCKILREHMGEEVARTLSDRFEIHYTPKHGSWLKQAEISIWMYSRQYLGDGRVENIDALKKRTTAWSKAANSKRQVIQWRFTKAKARKSMGYSH